MLHLFVNTLSGKYWTYFRQTFSIGAFWGKDEGCFNVWGQNIKGQGHSVTKDPAGGDVQSWMLCVEF